MNLVESLVDTNDTRFAGVTALEVFEADGRHFLLAGGADDGITLFEVTYKGQLDVLGSVADSAELTLQNVTDIEATVIDGTVNIFVSSATDHGFTQFSMNIPNGSNIIHGDAVVDILTGTAANDTIFGHGRNDELRGLGGDDRLIDGRGNDHLWGGEGADVFEFIADGRKDYIMDFEIGVDKIDLRDASMLYYYRDINFVPTADGVKLKSGDEQVIITTIDSTPLTIEMFTQDDFIFG
jgi:Ca2+-binding RTX toxin-like protein